MKTKYVIGAIGAALLASATFANAVTHRYMLWTHEVGTQAVWRDAEALVFIQEQNEGWHGGVIEWLFQLVRNGLGGPTSIVNSRTDLVVLRSGHDGTSRAVLQGVKISDLQQLDGALYAKSDEVIVRWNGAGFEPATTSERERLFDGHLRYGDYDQVGGWSVRTDVLAWGKNGKCIPMTVDKQQIQLCQQAEMLQRRKQLTLGPPGTAHVIWSLDSTGHDVSVENYDAAVMP